MEERPDGDLRDLQTFVVQLGAAMNTAGESVDSVQVRIARVARAYGAHSARISAFPTFMMVTMGRGEPATVELTSSLTAEPRLDQIAALDRLVGEAERGAVAPSVGLRRLEEIGEMGSRFGRVQSIVGYAVLSLGLCLILQPGSGELVAAAGLGGFVGLLRSMVRGQSPLQVLLPATPAAFSGAGRRGSASWCSPAVSWSRTPRRPGRCPVCSSCSTWPGPARCSATWCSGAT